MGDAHTTIDQDVEQLNAQKDIIVEEAKHAMALEAKMGQVRKAIEDLVGRPILNFFTRLFLMQFFFTLASSRFVELLLFSS